MAGQEPQRTFGEDLFDRLFDTEKTKGKQRPIPQSVETSIYGTHPKQARMEIRKRADGLDRLVFMYNPEELEEKVSASWEEGDEEGVSVQELQFKNTKNRQFTMTLFFNDWGETRQIPMPVGFSQVSKSPSKKPRRTAPGTMTEAAILWLVDCCMPRGISAGGEEGESAPVLELIWREVFTCVLVDVTVTRLKLSPGTMDAIRANVQITLMEHHLAIG